MSNHTIDFHLISVNFAITQNSVPLEKLIVALLVKTYSATNPHKTENQLVATK